MKVWEVTGAKAYSHEHGVVVKENNRDLGCISVDVCLYWWDRLRGITIQQKLELEVLRQRAWCAKQNHQERERAQVNEYLGGMVRRLNEKDKAKTLSNGIEIRKL